VGFWGGAGAPDRVPSPPSLTSSIRRRQDDIRTFDMHGVALEGAGSLVSLTVPGLAENRPSVLRGDAVVVQYHRAVQRPSDERRFRGYAHQVLRTHTLSFLPGPSPAL
jgi:hypothetical protein